MPDYLTSLSDVEFCRLSKIRPGDIILLLVNGRTAATLVANSDHGSVVIPLCGWSGGRAFYEYRSLPGDEALVIRICSPNWLVRVDSLSLDADRSENGPGAFWATDNDIGLVYGSSDGQVCLASLSNNPPPSTGVRIVYFGQWALEGLRSNAPPLPLANTCYET